MNISLQELERSLELYNSCLNLSDKRANNTQELVLVKQPPERQPTDIQCVCVAFGSFDPLTLGHTQLFLAATETARQNSHQTKDELLIVTSTNHIEKRTDFQKNAALYDRIILQQPYAQQSGKTSLALTNVAYFYELAPLVKNRYPNANLFFITGVDVLEKIANPTYYASLDACTAALETVFQHTFLISKRITSLDHPEPCLLDVPLVLNARPILQKYQHNIIQLSIPQPQGISFPLETMSSTLIRNLRHQGKPQRELEAFGTSNILDRYELYTPKDVYEATVWARQMFVQSHRTKGTNPLEYVDSLERYLTLVFANTPLRTHVIEYGRAGKSVF